MGDQVQERVQDQVQDHVSVRWVEPGATAFAALRAEVERLQGGDPLAPVTVVTPTPAAAVALRRRLGVGGFAAVSFSSMGGLAERLAARRLAVDGRSAAPHEAVVAAVRAAVADEPGAFRDVVAHRRTHERLAALAAELDRHGRPPVDGDGLSADAQRIARSALDRLGRFATGSTVAAAAVDAVTAGDAPEVGPVIVHLPRGWSPGEADLLGALGARNEVVVLAATTSDPALARALGSLGVAVEATDDSVVPAPTAVVSAPDADEEVRTVLRLLLARADEGVPLHEMAVAWGSDEPYRRLVVEQARAAGIPVRGPDVARLADGLAGRVLLAALDSADHGFSRDAIVDLISTGPLVGPDGDLVPASAWDELSRRAGVVAGLPQWDARLEAEAARADQRADTLEREGGEPAGARRQAARARAMRSFVLGLAHRLGELDSLTWSSVGPWVSELLGALLGPAGERRSWPPHELDAADRVEQALDGLAVLDTIDPEPTGDDLRAAVTAALDRPMPRRERSPGGLLIGPVGAMVGLDLRAVAVVGMVEGGLPRPGRDDPLLPDADRGRLGLPTSGDRVAEQRAAFAMTMSSASDHRILTWPRGDQRTGRSQIPSRWLLDGFEALAGHRPRVAAMIDGSAGAEHDWCLDVASHHGGLLAAPAPVDAHDARVVALAAHHAAGGALADHPATDGVLDELARARAQRRAGGFHRFHGDVGQGVDIAGGILSASGLERYATCPRRFFFSHVLGIGEVERPEALDRIDARERGTLSHTLLEQTIGEAIAAGDLPAPGEPWPQRTFERLFELAAELFADAEAKGKTGHAVRWAFDAARILDEAHEVLHRDVDVRRRHGTTPAEVELSFGFDDDGAPALELEVRGRTLRLRGYIDRVDSGPDRVHVIDYKTGRASTQKSLDEDPLDGGRRLQLAIYGLAAQRLDPAAKVRADYWYISVRGGYRLVGVDVDDELKDRLMEALDIIVGAADEGFFPARPGAWDGWFHTFDSCRFCDFDRACPGDRDLEWQRVRIEPRLRRYVELAEGPFEEDDGD